MTSDDLKQIGQLLDEKLTAAETKIIAVIKEGDNRVMAEIGGFMDDQLFT